MFLRRPFFLFFFCAIFKLNDQYLHFALLLVFFSFRFFVSLSSVTPWLVSCFVLLAEGVCLVSCVDIWICACHAYFRLLAGRCVCAAGVLTLRVAFVGRAVELSGWACAPTASRRNTAGMSCLLHCLENKRKKNIPVLSSAVPTSFIHGTLWYIQSKQN